MKVSCVALISDFSADEPFVGIMKGVILSKAPACCKVSGQSVPVIDVTHQIPPQDIFTASFYLMVSMQYFPKGTLFIIVVDPLVGTSRGIIWARTSNYQFLAPDNGVLGWVEEKERIIEARLVNNSKLFLSPTSSTFHGRDIMAPVAAGLARGLAPARLGPRIEEYKKNSFPKPTRLGNRVMGQVVAVDHFGNLITNITSEHINDKSIFHIRERILGGLNRTYACVGEGEPLALTGSFGFVEFSVRNGNFAKAFNAKAGDPVEVIVSL